MKRMDRLYDITKKIHLALEAPVKTNEERIELIEKINELLALRDKTLIDIVEPYTKEEMEIGNKVVALNDKIQVKMEALYDTVRQDLKFLKQKKDTSLSYINPFGKMKTVDGMYLDNKL